MSVQCGNCGTACDPVDLSRMAATCPTPGWLVSLFLCPCCGTCESEKAHRNIRHERIERAGLAALGRCGSVRLAHVLGVHFVDEMDQHRRQGWKLSSVPSVQDPDAVQGFGRGMAEDATSPVPPNLLDTVLGECGLGQVGRRFPAPEEGEM